jgi:hypothetical protein
MYIRLKLVIRYEAETLEGSPLGVFDKADDEWNGMMKLTADGGKSLIVDAPSWIDRLFGTMDVGYPDWRTALLVKGSPDLLALIQQSHDEKTKVAEPVST